MQKIQIVLIGVFVYTGSSRWLFQPGEDCEPEEGASAFPWHHHCWGEGLSQPSAHLHHKCAACRLSAPRWHHQKRYRADGFTFYALTFICLSVFYLFYFCCLYLQKAQTKCDSLTLFTRAPSISSGDVLLSINGVDLTQLTYNEAVSALKAQTAQAQVVLRVIQTLSEDTEEDTEAVSRDELDPVDDPRDSALNWTPLWTRWLGLPRLQSKSSYQQLWILLIFM